jgi:hypothetical protein
MEEKCVQILKKLRIIGLTLLILMSTFTFDFKVKAAGAILPIQYSDPSKTFNFHVQSKTASPGNERYFSLGFIIQVLTYKTLFSINQKPEDCYTSGNDTICDFTVSQIDTTKEPDGTLRTPDGSQKNWGKSVLDNFMYEYAGNETAKAAIRTAIKGGGIFKVESIMTTIPSYSSTPRGSINNYAKSSMTTAQKYSGPVYDAYNTGASNDILKGASWGNTAISDLADYFNLQFNYTVSPIPGKVTSRYFEEANGKILKSLDANTYPDKTKNVLIPAASPSITSVGDLINDPSGMYLKGAIVGTSPKVGDVVPAYTSITTAARSQTVTLTAASNEQVINYIYSSSKLTPVPSIAGIQNLTNSSYGRTIGDPLQNGNVYNVDAGATLPVKLQDRSSSVDPTYTRILYHRFPNGSVVSVKNTKGVIPDQAENLAIGQQCYWISIVDNLGVEYKSSELCVTVAANKTLNVLPIPIIGHKSGNSISVTSISGNVGDDFLLNGSPSYDSKGRVIIRYVWYIWDSTGSFATAQKLSNTTASFTKAQQDLYFSSPKTYNVRLYVQVNDSGTTFPTDPTTGLNAQIQMTISAAISQFPNPVLASTSHTVKTDADGKKYIEVLKSANFNVNGSGTTSPNGTIAKYIFNYRKVNGTPYETAWSADQSGSTPTLNLYNFNNEGIYEVRMAAIDAIGKDSRNNSIVDKNYDFMRINVGSLPGNPPLIDGIVQGIAYVNTPFVLVDKSTDVDHNLMPEDLAGHANSYINGVVWSIVEESYDKIWGPYAHYLSLAPTKRIDYAFADKDGVKGATTPGKLYFWRYMYPVKMDINLGVQSTTEFLSYQNVVDNSGNMTQEAYVYDTTTNNRQVFALSETPSREINIIFNRTGKFTLMQRVYDEEGNSRTRLYVVDVIQNLPPVAEFDTALSTGRTKPYQLFDYSSDPDDGILYYTWTVTHNGSTSTVKINKDTGAIVSSTLPAGTKADLSQLKAGDGNIIYQDIGTYTISQTVADHTGQQDISPSITVTVLNSKPENSIQTVPMVYVGNLMNATMASNDYDGTIASESLTMNGTPLSASEINSVKTSQYYFNTEGSYKFIYNVTDNDGATNLIPSSSITEVRKPIPSAIWLTDTAQSTLKENRQIIVDASLSSVLSEASATFPLDWASTEWVVTPVSGVIQSQINTKVLNGGKKLGLSIHGSGVIKIAVRVKNTGVQRMAVTGYQSEWYEQTMIISPDQAPIADFSISNPVDIRNSSNGNNIGIILQYSGGSNDGDSIANIEWYVRKDSNDNKVFDESWTLFSSSTQTNALYTTNSVGLYQFKIIVKEEFGQTYYSEFVSAADRKISNSDWKITSTSYVSSRDLGNSVSMIDDIAPRATFQITKDPTADILILVEGSQWAAFLAKDGNNMDQGDYLKQQLTVGNLLSEIIIKNYDPNIPIVKK